MSRLSCMKRDIRLLFCHNTELYGALDTLVDFYGRFVLSDRLHCVQSDIFAVYRDALFLKGLCQVGCGHRTEDAAFLCLGGDSQRYFGEFGCERLCVGNVSWPLCGRAVSAFSASTFLADSVAADGHSPAE